MARTHSTSYKLNSYARAHDYFDIKAGETPARYVQEWKNHGLLLILDEEFPPASSSAETPKPSLRLRITSSPEVDPYASSQKSQPPGAAHEELDLSLYQQMLKTSPELPEQTRFPLRVVYRGSLVVFRYQIPAAIPMPQGIPVAYRRFQLKFADQEDVKKVINAVKTHCVCFDQSDKAKSQNGGKTTKSDAHQSVPTTKPGSSDTSTSVPSHSGGLLLTSTFQPPLAQSQPHHQLHMPHPSYFVHPAAPATDPMNFHSFASFPPSTMIMSRPASSLDHRATSVPMASFAAGHGAFQPAGITWPNGFVNTGTSSAHLGQTFIPVEQTNMHTTSRSASTQLALAQPFELSSQNLSQRPSSPPRAPPLGTNPLVDSSYIQSLLDSPAELRQLVLQTLRIPNFYQLVCNRSMVVFDADVNLHPS
ncbi:hypothetical protein DL93DRAFT_1099952 [Clavulina sp. PMI_390]|nr:hypothetical protein DL93DRAFT_1099952 [Clavulina sp. PMI_390]